MTENAVFEVLHLDDQPELVAWIPRDISVWFWKNFTADMQDLPDDEEESEDERTFDLRLRACGEVFDTRYRIVTTTEELTESLAATPAGRVVLVLLDQAIGDNPAAGSDTYRHISKKHPEIAERVFILTAYPNLVQGQLGWSDKDAKLIVKPASPEKVIEHFIKGLVAAAETNRDTKAQLCSKI